MLEFEGINVWAVIAVWLVNVVVGSLWYSPAGFGKRWSKLSGVDIMKLPKDEANRAILFVALSAVVQAVTLGLVLNSLGVSNALEGLKVTLVLWLGLTAATTIGTNFYARKSWGFWWLNASYFLVVMAINGLILGAWL
jgi:hypothetical protein